MPAKPEPSTPLLVPSVGMEESMQVSPMLPSGGEKRPLTSPSEAPPAKKSR